MNTFDGDIYEKLFGTKNNAVTNSDAATDYVNQAKEDLSKLYNNNYISPNGSTNGTNGATTNGMNGSTANGMNGATTNGMNGSTTNGMNGATNGMNGTNNDTNCAAHTPLKPFPDKTPIGMAYIPFQQWETPYSDTKAFSKGTIFPSLDKPFIGKGAVNNVSRWTHEKNTDVWFLS